MAGPTRAARRRRTGASPRGHSPPCDPSRALRPWRSASALLLELCEVGARVDVGGVERQHLLEPLSGAREVARAVEQHRERLARLAMARVERRGALELGERDAANAP